MEHDNNPHIRPSPMGNPTWMDLLHTGQSAYCQVSTRFHSDELFKHNGIVCVLKPAWITERLSRTHQRWALKDAKRPLIHLGNTTYPTISSDQVNILSVTDPVPEEIELMYKGMCDHITDPKTALELLVQHRHALKVCGPHTRNPKVTAEAIQALNLYMEKIALTRCSAPL